MGAVASGLTLGNGSLGRRPPAMWPASNAAIHSLPSWTGFFSTRKEVVVDMRNIVETHWTEQRSEDQIDYLDA